MKGKTLNELNVIYKSHNVEAIFKKLGPAKAIKFFQSMGINKGDSVKEIESITEKMSREEVVELMKKANRR